MTLAVNPRLTGLAIHGGPKVRTAPWPLRRHIGEEEKLAVTKLFDDSIRSGDELGYDGAEEQAYCREFAEFQGGGFADGVSSGTAAIYVGLRMLGIEPFTEVIVPPVTDAGGVMPVPLNNCIPIPADSAPGSLNAGPEQIIDRMNERTSAVIVAHISGHPVDMDPIMQVARERGIFVIEDCSQAHGASYKGRMVGTIGDVGAFSTMSGKHHATGAQGGVVFVREESRYWQSRWHSDRGKPFGVSDWRVSGGNLACALNFNLSDLAATIGRVQLRKLPSNLARRRRFARRVAEACREMRSISVDTGLPDAEGAYWFLLFKLDLRQLTVDKETFVRALAAEGLPVSADYLHLFTRAPWYQKREVFGKSGHPWSSPQYKGDPNQRFAMPNLMAAHASIFRMAVHESLGERELNDTITALKKVEAAYLQSC